jgi:hypothetical protein
VFAVAGIVFCTSLIAQGPAPVPRPALVLTHVNVVDVSGGTVRRDMDVAIRDGRIASVSPSARGASPGDARAIDATGKFLIPGLAEMHAHWYDERYLGLFIANGVTSVRLMWGFPVHFQWRKRIEAGQLLGPRFTIASAIVDGPNPIWPNSVVVADAASGTRVVGEMKRDGYDFIKVYNRLPRDAYFAIARAAKESGIPFAGHVPNAVSALEASDAGQKSIEHNNGVLIAASSAEARVREETLRLWTGGEANQGIDANRRAGFRKLNEDVLATFDARSAGPARFRKRDPDAPTPTVLRAMSSLDDPRSRRSAGHTCRSRPATCGTRRTIPGTRRRPRPTTRSSGAWFASRSSWWGPWTRRA